MNPNLSNIWDETLELMKQELTTVSFNTWLGSIDPISINNNQITLLTPNDFNKQILEDRYLNLIKNAINQVTSENYNIQIIIPRDLNKNNNLEDEDDYKSGNENLNNENSQEYAAGARLNPKYVFEEFVIGSSNRFAHAASLAVAESPAKAYNPLFVYGGVGLGKTHLMHAIGHYILNKNSDAEIVYVTSEKFTNELINSIKDDKNVEFRNKYRNADVLLVDDIQFIAGKERTQEEFFHTFNALHEANKQIILSSDRPPKEIPTLEDRLRSRFEWGLITDIQAPDYETRIAILRKKAENENVEIPNDVIEFIASKIKSNIRELEGALTRIIAYSSLTNKNISVELANEALKDILANDKPKEITVDLIKSIVAKHYGIEMSDFESRKRTRNISFPRQIAMYICRNLTDLSLPKIGEEFGGRDHTTVIHAKDKIYDKMEDEKDFKYKIEEIIKDIKKK